MANKKGWFIPCKNCGKSVYITPWYVKARRSFCSRYCQGKYLITHEITGMGGKKHSQKTKEKMSKSHMGIIAGIVAVAKKKITSIEAILYKELDLRGIYYISQYSLDNKFLVDAYIPALKLVIEADGKYWHSLPRSKKRDILKEEYCKTNHYQLLRLSEKEINDESFKERMVL